MADRWTDKKKKDLGHVLANVPRESAFTESVDRSSVRENV